MEKIKKALAFSLSLLMLLGAFGCTGGTADETSTPPPVSDATPNPESTLDVPDDVTYQDTITIGVANDITTLDPQGSNTDANMMAFILTHETLVEVDPETNEVIPGMANLEGFRGRLHLHLRDSGQCEVFRRHVLYRERRQVHL